MKLQWRGASYDVQLSLTKSTRIVDGNIVLWPPRDHVGWAKDNWIADTKLPGARIIEAQGGTAQAALDALAALLPAQPMVRGGSC